MFWTHLRLGCLDFKVFTYYHIRPQPKEWLYLAILAYLKYISLCNYCFETLNFSTVNISHLLLVIYIQYNSVLSSQAKSCFNVVNALLLVFLSFFSSSILHISLNLTISVILEDISFQTNASLNIEHVSYIMSTTTCMCTHLFITVFLLISLGWPKECKQICIVKS